MVLVFKYVVLYQAFICNISNSDCFQHCSSYEMSDNSIRQSMLQQLTDEYMLSFIVKVFYGLCICALVSSVVQLMHILWWSLIFVVRYDMECDQALIQCVPLLVSLSVLHVPFTGIFTTALAKCEILLGSQLYIQHTICIKKKYSYL